MYFHWDTTTIVPHRDLVALAIDDYLDGVHSGVVHLSSASTSDINHLVVRGIDEDFIKDLEETRDVCDIPMVSMAVVVLTC